MNRRLIAVCTTMLLAEPAFAKQLDDARRLDELEQLWGSLSNGQTSEDQYWRASKRLADERGVAVIDAILARSSRWPGEEGLIFAATVAFVPRHAALRRLHQYEHSKRDSERVWASEFITEFEMPDTMAGVEKYSKLKK